MNEEQVAKVCHEVNRAICEANRDYSQANWEFARDWQKASAIKGVKFAIANPETTPEGQHNQWCKDKYKDGWKYGKDKDGVKKTHPCLVHYDELPYNQRVKDIVFRAIVKALVGL